MKLRPGDAFDRYTIEAEIGEGGMGTVYRATDTKLHRQVALKVLRVDVGARGSPEAAEARARLVREARAAAALDHANAVAIFDVGDHEGAPYIAMELVVGKPLRSYVGDAAVSLKTRVRWLADVARALDAAHGRGLVHRDVKPENVMVKE
jgi:eukaryotic-like serine/threonine-protein kinase